MSTCETGLAHEVLAEPVSGPALALRTAGVRRLIASMWDVDNDATAELMKELYRPIVKKRISFGEELTLAKRKLVATEKRRHPFFWAAFVLLGR